MDKIDKNICVMGIDKNIDEKINKVCKDNNVDREFFIAKALENQIAMMEQNPKLVEKINKLCEEHGMSRIFFFTKALENYCKYLSRKKNKED
jgi:hypothetical protein